MTMVKLENIEVYLWKEYKHLFRNNGLMTPTLVVRNGHVWIVPLQFRWRTRSGWDAINPWTKIDLGRVSLLGLSRKFWKRNIRIAMKEYFRLEMWTSS